MLDYLFRFHWATVDVSAAFLVHVCSEDYSHLSMIKLESVLQEVINTLLRVEPHVTSVSSGSWPAF